LQGYQIKASEYCFYYRCEKGILEVNRSLVDDSLNHLIE
jgi:hypothetical protein